MEGLISEEEIVTFCKNSTLLEVTKMRSVSTE